MPRAVAAAVAAVVTVIESYNIVVDIVNISKIKYAL